MLVHKASMGILVEVYTGVNRSIRYEGMDRSLPQYRRVTLRDVDDPENWWEVPDSSTLGIQLKRYYPDVIPHVDEKGQLVSITPIGRLVKYAERDALAEEAKKKALAEANERGYANAYNIRPTKIFPFLNVTEEEEQAEIEASIRNRKKSKRRQRKSESFSSSPKEPDDDNFDPTKSDD